MQAICFCDYWVLLIDILGFSRRISNPATSEALASGYVEVVEGVIRKNVIPETMQHVQPAEAREKLSRLWLDRVRVFSDSIFIFFSGPDVMNPAAAAFLLPVAAKQIARELWRKRLPHRGAIAYGECYIDPKLEIFVGPAIVAAHEWEQAQKWLGVSVAPGSLLAAQGNLGKGSSIGITRTSFETDVDVPTAEGNKKTWVLNPFKGYEGTDVFLGFRDCYRDAQREGCRSVLSKYENTSRLLRLDLDSRGPSR